MASPRAVRAPPTRNRPPATPSPPPPRPSHAAPVRSHAARASTGRRRPRSALPHAALHSRAMPPGAARTRCSAVVTVRPPAARAVPRLAAEACDRGRARLGGAPEQRPTPAGVPPNPPARAQAPCKLALPTAKAPTARRAKVHTHNANFDVRTVCMNVPRSRWPCSPRNAVERHGTMKHDDRSW